MKVLLKEKYLLNKNQCSNLCKTIKHVMEVFDHLIICTNDKLRFEFLLSELFLALKKSLFFGKKM